MPGGTFQLPAFSREGDYELAAIRLVDAASGGIVAPADPPAAELHVRRVVVAQLDVAPLSLADLAARGISLSQQNYQAFNFRLGLLFGTQEVQLELPVVFDGSGTVSPLARPSVPLDGLPRETVHLVERWSPPFLVPFRLEVPASEARELGIEEDAEVAQMPLLGAIVIPGSVSFLHQFFDARLVVANGAPAASGARLAGVTAALRLPSGEVLRVVESAPAAGAGLRVPVRTKAGSGELAPAETGEARWTLEGLRSGRHPLRVEISGTLERPGRDPAPLAGLALASVEVVDPRFHLSFSHPEVVNEGEEYGLFVTVTNLSKAPQRDIRVALAAGDLTGASLVAGQPLPAPIPVLVPGESETVEFRLVAGVSGRCVATALEARLRRRDRRDSSSGRRRRAGDSALGGEPRPSAGGRGAAGRAGDGRAALPRPRLRPRRGSSGLVPPGLAQPGRPFVERRALELAGAGRRLGLGEGRLESLEQYALDRLGGRAPSAPLDELRRKTEKGRLASSALAAVLREEQRPAPAGRTLGAAELVDHLSRTLCWAKPFLAATLVPVGPGAAPAFGIRRIDAGGIGVLARSSDEASPLREVPTGEVLAVRSSAAADDTVPLALVGRVDDGAVYRVIVEGTIGTPAPVRLVGVFPVGKSMAPPSGFAIVESGPMTVPAGEAWELELVPAGGSGTAGLRWRHAGSTIEVDPAPAVFVHPVDPPAFAIVGAVQDFRPGAGKIDPLGNVSRPNRYGNGVSYLFNRPPSAASLAATGLAASFRFTTTFTGFDIGGASAEGVSPKRGEALFVQPDDERLVVVRFDSPPSLLAPVLPAGSSLESVHEVTAGALRDDFGEVLGSVPPVRLGTGHTWGLLDGRVKRGRVSRWPGPGSSFSGRDGSAGRWTTSSFSTGPRRPRPTSTGTGSSISSRSPSRTATSSRDSSYGPRSTRPATSRPRSRRSCRESGGRGTWPTRTSRCSGADRSPAGSFTATERRRSAAR